jgi:AraC-like DNA-binding protein
MVSSQGGAQGNHALRDDQLERALGWLYNPDEGAVLSVSWSGRIALMVFALGDARDEPYPPLGTMVGDEYITGAAAACGMSEVTWLRTREGWLIFFIDARVNPWHKTEAFGALLKDLYKTPTLACLLSEDPELVRVGYANMVRADAAHHRTVGLLAGRAESFVKARYADDQLCLGQVAMHLAVSEGHLSREFKKGTGKSFSDYLIDLPLDEAQRLLRCSQMTIYEIAQRVGFSSQHYFSAQFKRKTGLAPSAYRGRN